MHVYHIVVSDLFEKKFESFLDNINRVNSKQVATIISKSEIVATPKEDKGEAGTRSAGR